MTEPNRSRTAWPGPTSMAGLEPGHEHQLPQSLVDRVQSLRRRVRLLTGAVVIFGVCLLAIGTFLVLLVLSRSAQRDQENERTNQRINDSICDLLDQLPEGGLLERPRAKYGCGPGIPLELLTPEEQRRIQTPPEPVPAPTVVPQNFSGGVVQQPPATQPGPPPRPDTTCPPTPCN